MNYIYFATAVAVCLGLGVAVWYFIETLKIKAAIRRSRIRAPVSYSSRLMEGVQVSRDQRRLLFVHHMVEGAGGMRFSEQAALYASARGHDAPNDDDYLAAIRDAIDTAMWNHAFAKTKEL